MRALSAVVAPLYPSLRAGVSEKRAREVNVTAVDFAQEAIRVSRSPGGGDRV